MIANGNSYTVRLVTTQSSARSFSRLATEWIWYWKDEYGNWNEYIARDGCNKVGISSKEIEDAYAQSTPQLGFSTESYEYEIDLQHMVQHNLSVSTERPVSRRPRLPLVGGRENSHLPPHWDKQHGSGNIAFVEVNRGCSEWSIIANLFEKTLPNESLKKIVRIQNEELWGSFCWKKKWMQKSLTDDEKLLFHGTKQEYIDRIAQEGFDWRNSGSSVGALFGEGSYFARDASYSKHYTDSRQLFVVRVLVGKTAQGKAHYRKPPSNYNSCVDNPSNPTIYVIFDFAQTYPEYLITY
ncbi:hypothetical protein CAPTEDRAFT_97279 [Capitella teleta]|uniref:Poly [ADP-ribose] polymerase n=1 Tax=Capitella teleta TaxID=283909 RepID=R7TL09_CAPTE|nr:hypothetical protein CAPTEDRAFT_97279 [Capitella teleta]|eukprot:ELT94319.1 hypothetical protein CAPTEDRAFT_97279 [Capitella teleta]